MSDVPLEGSIETQENRLSRLAVLIDQIKKPMSYHVAKQFVTTFGTSIQGPLPGRDRDEILLKFIHALFSYWRDGGEDLTMLVYWMQESVTEASDGESRLNMGRSMMRTSKWDLQRVRQLHRHLAIQFKDLSADGIEETKEEQQEGRWPLWVEADLPCNCKPHERDSSELYDSDDDEEDYDKLNEARDLMIDLIVIGNVLDGMAYRYLDTATKADSARLPENPEREQVVEALRECLTAVKLEQNIPDPDNLDIDGLPANLEQCNRFKQGLVQLRDAISRAETYLHNEESDILASKDAHKSNAYLSRFARACERKNLRSVLHFAVTSDLKQMFSEILKGPGGGQQVALPSQQNIQDPMCPVCQEDVDLDAASKPRSTHHCKKAANDEASWVSTKCCGKTFHADCLLEWSFSQISRGRNSSCPMCRGTFDMEFIGEAVEVKTRQMKML